MNEDRIAALLKALPPDAPQNSELFDQVAARVRRRRRLNTSLVFVVVLLIALPAAFWLTRGSSSDSGDQVATDPASIQPAPATTPTDIAPGRPVIPGADKVTGLSEPVTVEHIGTATIELGTRPPGVTGVSVSFTCLSRGTFTFPAGSSMTCTEPDGGATGGPPESPEGVIDLEAGQTEILIRAAEKASWRATTTYVRTEPTHWGTNSKGETYGVDKGGCSPDLIAVLATNGKTGYSYATDLRGPAPTSPAEALKLQRDGTLEDPFSVPVYESDGQTRIGTFQSSTPRSPPCDFE